LQFYGYILEGEYKGCGFGDGVGVGGCGVLVGGILKDDGLDMGVGY
jgi:hypothetical protein